MISDGDGQNVCVIIHLAWNDRTFQELTYLFVSMQEKKIEYGAKDVKLLCRYLMCERLC
eukprot:SAG31_NODE_2800_length_5077_cov_2.098433_5_plen_59_part_00